MWLVAEAAGNGDGLDVPERGLQVSPFMMFMLFMGMVYVVLTLQQRATRQVRAHHRYTQKHRRIGNANRVRETSNSPGV